jgi:hypothetical protein
MGVFSGNRKSVGIFLVILMGILFSVCKFLPYEWSSLDDLCS